MSAHDTLHTSASPNTPIYGRDLLKLSPTISKLPKLGSSVARSNHPLPENRDFLHDGMRCAVEFVRTGADLRARFGYTTAQEGRSTPSSVKAVQTVADFGGLKIDVATYPDVLVDRDIIKNSQSPTCKNRFRVAGAKLTIDGTPQGYTAWRDRPYYKPVGSYPSGYVGYPAAKAEQVRDAIDWAFANNIRIITHPPPFPGSSVGSSEAEFMAIP